MRLRLRTARLSVALLSPPLYCVAVVARHGGFFSYLRYEVALASACYNQAERRRAGIELLGQHAAPEHCCERCREYTQPVGELILQEEKRLREWESAG